MKVITSGVYVLFKNGNVVYVGESNNILGRIGEHIRDGAKDFDEFDYCVANEKERKELEAFLIQLIKPKYNIQGVNRHPRKKNYFDSILLDYAKDLENAEKKITLKRLADILSRTSSHLYYVLKEKMDAPLELEYQQYVIDLKWLHNNFEKLIDLI